jgi:Cyclic phosphodiesterase-like protein
MISIWLTPTSNDRSELSAVIDDLAVAFDAPIFEPHVTIATSDATAVVITDALRTTTKGIQAIRLNAAKVGFSRNLTNGLYISMDASDQFRSLVYAIHQSHPSLNFRDTEPRLSLLYRVGTEAWKRQIAQSLDFSNRTYEFDTIKVVQMHDSIENGSDVTDWNVQSTIRLLPRENSD